VAVSNAEVVAATTDVPANVPGRKPAIPITLANTAGNTVILDLGHGHYAHYMHLQPGSVRVKAGDLVERGQVLGLIGNSGDSFAPHLHFEITTAAATLGGEGVPYVFDSFEVVNGEPGTTVLHREELPLEKMLVDFANQLPGKK
jgi:murein DD-endopeptidase MepM/ murein hydrolase activator NlpD